MLQNLVKNLVQASCASSLVLGISTLALAVEKPKAKAVAATGAEAGASEVKDVGTAEGAKDATPAKKVRYKKSKQVDFSNQTVEGKLHRPEASLVTASEGVTDNGLLRLRENFLDKFTTFVGEEIEQ